MKLNRHEERIKAMQILYAWEQNPTSFELIWNAESVQDSQKYPYARELVQGVLKQVKKIDATINKHLINWKFSRLYKVDLAILRMAIYTLLFIPELDRAIIINEAIEIAKEYSNEHAPKFINGILDAISKNERKGDTS